MRISFTIPGRLPGLNEYISAERTNRYKGAVMKRESQRIAAAAIGKAHPLKAPVKIDYFFFERDKRRDKDNVAAFAHKVIQDALVQKKVIRNDGWRYIKGWNDYFEVDEKNPRIEVYVCEDWRNG